MALSGNWVGSVRGAPGWMCAIGGAAGARAGTATQIARSAEPRATAERRFMSPPTRRLGRVPARPERGWKDEYRTFRYIRFLDPFGARSSAWLECLLDTQDVTGTSTVAPTEKRPRSAE